MKFKSVEQLKAYRQAKLDAKYNTVLSEPLSEKEIDAIKGSVDVKVSELNNAKLLFDQRVTSLLKLICEIDDVGYGWWAYEFYDNNSPMPTEIEISNYNFSYYFEPSYGKNNFESISLCNEQTMPIEYLSMSTEEVIKDYIERTFSFHHLELLKKEQDKQKREIQKNKTKDYEKSFLTSIKSKLTEEEFDFVVKKIGYTKKKFEELEIN